jgi:hypothetical protein
MQHIWRRGEVLTGFKSGNLKGGEPGADGRVILNGSSGSGMMEHGLD